MLLRTIKKKKGEKERWSVLAADHLMACIFSFVNSKLTNGSYVVGLEELVAVVLWRCLAVERVNNRVINISTKVAHA